MARKKTITKDQILNAAYNVVATEGFSRFTARNIASKMKCSTQPIYLEFKNMDDLKAALFEKIRNYLENDLFSVEKTGDHLIDLVLNYTEFAVKEKAMYRALYIENYSGNDVMNKFSHEVFDKTIAKEARLKDISQEKKQLLFAGTWIVATGLASLMSSGLINLSQKEIISITENTVQNILSNEEPPFNLEHSF